jgi:DNA polymerase epsilon subunit 1
MHCAARFFRVASGYLTACQHFFCRRLQMGGGGGRGAASDPLRLLIELREYDVPYYMRAAIDCDVRVGLWFRVLPQRSGLVKVESMKVRKNTLLRADEGGKWRRWWKSNLLVGCNEDFSEGISPISRFAVQDFHAASEPRVLAWDIETTKAPLKFPDAAFDQIYMISYMLDRQGFLIINREVGPFVL